MRRTLLLLILFLVVSWAPTRAWAFSSRRLALIYDGPGACQESCAQAAAEVAHQAGLRTRIVFPTEITHEILEKAAVWIQPGGDAIDVAHAISPAQMELLRNFVHGGGAYLGFCAGAFFADRTVDNADTIPGLGIIAATTYDYPGPPGPALLPILWHDQTRQIYFESGGSFRFDAGAEGQFEVIARYPDNAPAVVETHYGKGIVIASGVHPEAPEFWKESENLVDPDGPDLDLALELVNRAIQR